MATITGLTAERMREIEAASIVDGHVDASGHLILTRYDGSQIDAGSALASVSQNALVKYLNATSFTETTPPLSYPDGVSFLWISDVESVADWPTFSGKWGTLHTVNWSAAYSDGDTNQVWTKLHSSGTPEQWIRSGNGTGWSAWKKLALSDEVTALAESQALALESVENDLGADITSTNVRVSAVEGRATTLENRATAVEGRATTLENRLGPVYAIQCGNGTVPNVTITALGYGAAPLSPANGYVRATNRITVPSAGTYLVTYRYKVGGSVGAGRAFVELTLASLSNYQYTIPADTTTFGRSPIGEGEDAGVLTSTVTVTAGAQIGANAFQSSGSAKSLDGVLNIQRIS